MDPARPNKADPQHQSPPPPQPTRVGDYVILSTIGTGSMGTVYQAKHAATGKPFALKLLRPTRFTRQVLDRCRAEAGSMSRLGHPYICQLVDVGVATGSSAPSGPAPYIVTELVRGARLDEYAQRPDLDPRARVELLAMICDAVEHAHQKGIIHRDLKPANILVTKEGRPKVLDFGIAHAIDAELRESDASDETRKLIGTPAYMSPEQASRQASRLDARSDVYSLGVVGYELVSRHLPYDVRQKSVAQVLQTIRTRPPRPLGEVEPKASGDLEVVFACALEKQPKDRYDSAAALAEDLRRWLAGHAVRARRPKLWAGLGQVARQTRSAVDAVRGVLHRGGEAPQPPQHAPRAVSAGTAAGTWQERLRHAMVATRQGDCAMALTWLTSALHVASRVEPEIEPALRTYAAVLLQQSPRLLDLDPAAVDRAGLPPADRTIEVGNDERASAFQARVVDEATGRTLLGPLWHHGAIADTAFSGDGRMVLTTCADEVGRTWSARHDHPAARFDGHTGAVSVVVFDAHGQRAVTAGADGRAFILTGDALAVLATLAHDAAVNHAAFTPDGRLVVTCGDDRTARVWDAATGRALGAPIVHDQPVREVHFVREAKQVATVTADGAAQVFDVLTGKPFTPRLAPDTQVYRALMREARLRGAVEFSPARPGVELPPQLARVLAAAGLGLIGSDAPTASAELRRGAAAVRFATFSRDGRLAVVIDPKSDALLWDVKQCLPLSAALDGEHRVTHAAFSPDGTRAVVGSSDGAVRAWSVAPDARAIEDLKLVSEVLSSHLVDDTLGLYPLRGADWTVAWSRARKRTPELFGSTS